MEHIEIPLGEIHIPVNWQFADATAREAYTPVEADAGLWALQLDDLSIWRVTEDSSLDWEQVNPSAAAPVGTLEIILNSTASATAVADPADIGKMLRFTGTGAKTLEFDSADGWSANTIISVTNRAASGNLTLTEAGTMTLNPPKGGTLVLEPGDTVSVHFNASDDADVMGSTEAA